MIDSDIIEVESVVVPPLPEPEDGVEQLIPDPWEEPEEGEKAKQTRKRTKKEREEDLVVVAEMWHEKKSAAEIARHLSSIRRYKIGSSQIAYDMRELEERYRLKTTRSINVAKANELAYIERLEREAWEAWEASKGDEVMQRREVYTRNGNPSSEATITERKKRFGDPVILDKLIKLHERRCKIQGLEAAVKAQVEVSGTIDGGVDLIRLREQLVRKAIREHEEQKQIENKDVIEQK